MQGITSANAGMETNLQAAEEERICRSSAGVHVHTDFMFLYCDLFGQCPHVLRCM